MHGSDSPAGIAYSQRLDVGQSARKHREEGAEMRHGVVHGMHPGIRLGTTSDRNMLDDTSKIAIQAQAVRKCQDVRTGPQGDGGAAVYVRATTPAPRFTHPRARAEREPPYAAPGGCVGCEVEAGVPFPVRR